jgi:pimeloyl-ACP methyl ester carboxylesterase
MSTDSPDTSLSAAAISTVSTAATGSCRPPASVRDEVRRYDDEAILGTWSGPRYRMTYRVLGEGPPLLWLPGIASTYRVYALVLNRLAQRFQTIQYAYPGDHPDDEARLTRIAHDHLVDDLIGLIDYLGLGRVFLAGISFGSTIALKSLHRKPGNFARSVVQGAFAHRRFTTAERLALLLGRQLPGTAARLPLRETVLRYNSKMDFPGVIADRWPFYLEENGRTPIKALAHRTSLVARLDLRPLLPQIDAELLLVQGKEDRIVPAVYHEELKAALPRAESLVMPTVGHIPHLTHAELLAQVIGEWLLPCDPAGCPRAGEADSSKQSSDADACAACPAAVQNDRSNPASIPVDLET